jgi:hypothetical protein
VECRRTHTYALVLEIQSPHRQEQVADSTGCEAWLIEFGRGLLSFAQIVGGKIVHRQNTANLAPLIGFTISVIGGAIQRVARAHRPIYDDKLGQEVRPVLLAQMPSGPDERRLYASLLTEIGAPFHTAERIATLETLTHVLLQRLRVRLVVIDEVHNLLAGSQREQRRALNVLKTLANILQAVVVAVGTGEPFCDLLACSC